MEVIVNKLTNQRIRLDAIKKVIKALPNSRGTSIAFTCLEKGRMYVGEILRELGKKYPYESTKKATTAEEIVNAVDTADYYLDLSDNEIVNLNTIRESLLKEINVIEKVATKLKPSFVMNCIVSEAYRGIKETRMYLGIRLGEIRDINNKAIQKQKTPYKKILEFIKK